MAGTTIYMDDVMHGIMIIMLLLVLGTEVYLAGRCGGTFIPVSSSSSTTTSPATTTTINYPTVNCAIKSGKLYYSPSCPHCQQQLSEGGLNALARSGVSIQLLDVTKENYDFIEAVPTFIVDNQTYVGYRTWNELLTMFQCQ